MRSESREASSENEGGEDLGNEGGREKDDADPESRSIGRTN